MREPPVLILHHHPLFGLGVAEKELSGSGLRPVIVDGPGGELPPRDTAGIACILSLGGPQAVGDLGEYPWMRREIDLLAEAIQDKIPVLGLGLGARLLAKAAGGEVNPLVWHGRHWLEAGWAPVIRTDGARAGDPSLLGLGDALRALPASLEAFHFHHETVSLPRSGVTIAASACDDAQAFTIDGMHVGFQFLLEATEATVFGVVAEWKGLFDACGIGEAQLTMDTLRRLHANELAASQVFGRFFAAASERVAK